MLIDLNSEIYTEQRHSDVFINNNGLDLYSNFFEALKALYIEPVIHAHHIYTGDVKLHV